MAAMMKAAILLFAAALAAFSGPTRAPDTPHAPTPTPAPAVLSAPDAGTPDVPSGSPAPTPFTFVWFPDTQTSAYYQPEALAAMGKYVASRAEAFNIIYVLSTGDLVDNGFKQWEWDNFYLAYDRFKDRVPFFPIAGNHDLGVKKQNWQGYLRQPCVQAAADDLCQFEGGKAAFCRVSAGGTDFLIVGVGYGAEKESAAWVREIFARYPNDYGILLAHEYLHAKKGIYGNGEILYDEVVSKCENLRLVLCGHFRGTWYRTDEFDDDGDGTLDRTVQTMLMNYQGRKKLGGQLRLMTFDPAAREITVKTLSALTFRNMRDDYFKSSVFTIPY